MGSRPICLGLNYGGPSLIRVSELHLDGAGLVSCGS